MTLALHTYEDKEEEIQYDILDDGTRVEVNSSSKTSSSSATSGGDSSTEDLDVATNDEVKQLKERLLAILNGVKSIQSEAKLSMMR